MALNLVRNSKVFFTSSVDAITGVVNTAGLTNLNTSEIQVLDGFAFSQNTNAETVTISEAGGNPVRGQRAFNTSLAPVDFNFSNYIRPLNAGGAIACEESVLWNALFSDQAISTANTVTVGGTLSGVTHAFSNTTNTSTITISGTGLTAVGIVVGEVVVLGGITAVTPTTELVHMNASARVVSISGTSIVLTLINSRTAVTTITTPASLRLFKSAWAPVTAAFSHVGSGGSDRNQLQKFGMIFIVDQVVYIVDNCALNQVTIDFGLDAIAMGAWAGQGTVLRQFGTDGATAVAGTFGGALTGTFTPKVTTAQFITNKLSTVSARLVNAIGASPAGTQYGIALTGGSITISNNITYITPANLGIVNTPVTYYTGTRAISGTLNAYLKTGTGVGGTGQLLADMLAAASSSVEPMVALQIAIGGGANSVRVILDMPGVVLTIPTVDVQQVVSTAISFTAQGVAPSATANGNFYDLEVTNDISIKYFA